MSPPYTLPTLEIMKELTTHSIKEFMFAVLQIEIELQKGNEARSILREARDEERLIRSEIREDERNERRLDRAKARLEKPKPTDRERMSSHNRFGDFCIHNIPWKDPCGNCEMQFCKHGRHSKQGCSQCGW